MIKINLLPYRAARKKENIRRQVSVFVLFFVFLAMALFFYHISLSSKISKLEDTLAFKEKELKTYQAKVQEVDELTDQLAILQKKLDVMEKLKKDRMAMVDLMDALVAITVKGRMWITNVGQTEAGTNIEGLAVDNKTVAVFMARVEKHDFFSGALLKDLVLDEKTGLKLKKFNLMCLKKEAPKEQQAETATEQKETAARSQKAKKK